MILAGIDIGTNTLRLLIADAGPATLRQLVSDRIITRLGQGIDRSGMLAPDAQERSISALARFAEQVRLHSVTALDAVGTSALRTAGNAQEFIRDVKDRTGLDIRVITGDEEARLTLLGVRSAFGEGSPAEQSGACMVLDVGGGSTEVILARTDGESTERSLPMGAVYLTERFLLHDPPHQEEIATLRMSVREALRSLDEAGGAVRPTGLIGTAGTITTLAAMHLEMEEYDPVRINGSRLRRQDLDRLVTLLAGKSIGERRAIKGLEPGREDIILAGAIVVQEIMERTGAADLLVSDWGLREGIVLDLYKKLRGTAD